MCDEKNAMKYTFLAIEKNSLTAQFRTSTGLVNQVP